MGSSPIVLNMNEHIIVAALKAVMVESEVDYIFDVFKINSTNEKSELLMKTMGGTYFDLPKGENAKYAILLTMFLDGHWRYADKISQIKEIVNSL